MNDRQTIDSLFSRVAGKRIYRVLGAAMAGTLSLSLVAFDQKPPSVENVGKEFDRAVDKADRT